MRGELDKMMGELGKLKEDVDIAEDKFLSAISIVFVMA